jgi:hypothetical protein
MNNVERRLLRVFVASGGDPADAAAVGRFHAWLDVQVRLLPAGCEAALRLARAADDGLSYAALARRLTADERRIVSPSAVRQRVYRSLSAVEAAWRRRVASGSS